MTMKKYTFLTDVVNSGTSPDLEPLISKGTVADLDPGHDNVKWLLSSGAIELVEQGNPILDQNAENAIKAIEETELAQGDLEALLAAEQEGKKRKTVLEAITKKLIVE